MQCSVNLHFWLCSTINRFLSLSEIYHMYIWQRRSGVWMLWFHLKFRGSQVGRWFLTIIDHNWSLFAREKVRPRDDTAGSVAMTIVGMIYLLTIGPHPFNNSFIHRITVSTFLVPVLLPSLSPSSPLFFPPRAPLFSPFVFTAPISSTPFASLNPSSLSPFHLASPHAPCLSLL